jgi:hypothetical protein
MIMARNTSSTVSYNDIYCGGDYESLNAPRDALSSTVILHAKITSFSEYTSPSLHLIMHRSEDDQALEDITSFLHTPLSLRLSDLHIPSTL